jgi:CRISPR/Cas system-associated endonuclease Cas1
LDPYFGFVHGSKRNQGSLVFDVIEEFRAPFADRFVFGMLGRGFKSVVGEHAHLRTESRMHPAKGFIKRWILPFAWR